MLVEKPRAGDSEAYKAFYKIWKDHEEEIRIANDINRKLRIYESLSLESRKDCENI